MSDDNTLTMAKLQAIVSEFKELKQSFDEELARHFGVNPSEGDCIIIPEADWLQLNTDLRKEGGLVAMPSWIRPSAYLRGTGIILNNPKEHGLWPM